MNTSATSAYHRRFRKVLEYIDAHLDEELSLESLSAVAAFSKYHFHRQFSELFELGVHKYVQLVRLRRASRQLAFQSDLRVIDIALESGYESPEAFARAFKKAVGQTPSEFRERPEWIPWHTTYEPLVELRSKHMSRNYSLGDVEVAYFETTRVAVLEHRGDHKLLFDSVRKFIDWRRQNRLPPKLSATFNILYDDPYTTPPEQFRFDLCAAISRAVEPNDVGVVERSIPGGRCARLRYVGSEDGMGEALTFMYAQWLPQSGEEVRDFPLFLQRVRFPPEVPEHESEIDFYLPLV
ncbi:MAG TPA: AraC family transcriptional regulator [Polyangiaceae bacterium]|nr:AraC family transcriptional regulator [Polyangiaceae bacterium]